MAYIRDSGGDYVWIDDAPAAPVASTYVPPVAQTIVAPDSYKQNVNVGVKINGGPVLDLLTFENVVVNKLRNAMPTLTYQGLPDTLSCVVDMAGNSSFPGLNTVGLCRFYLLNFDFRKYTTSMSFEGGEGANTLETFRTDLDALRRDYLAALNAPGAVFLFDGEQGTGNGRDRLRTAYTRRGNVVLPLATRTYYQSGSWVDIRGGLIFVFGIIFSLVGVPVISAALTDVAAGVAIGSTTATAATTTSALTTVASTGGQLIGAPVIGDAAKLVSAAYGQVNSGDALSTATTEGNTMFEDISFGGTGDSAFEGFNFSSGESTPFFGDAQVNDYGFGGYSGLESYDFAFNPDGAGFGSDVYDFGSGTGGAYDFNSTPEVTTNDFGTTWDKYFGDTSVKTAVDGVKLATTASGVIAKTGTSGTVASSGGSGAKAQSIATGSNDILATFGSFLGTITGTAKTLAGTNAQKTTAQQKTYAGQLTPQGGAGGTIAGVPMNTLLVAGVGLLALGLLMKKA